MQYCRADGGRGPDESTVDGERVTRVRAYAPMLCLSAVQGSLLGLGGGRQGLFCEAHVGTTEHENARILEAVVMCLGP